MVTLLDSRIIGDGIRDDPDLVWEMAKICQFQGILNADAICSVQPNLQLSLYDEHISSTLLLCVEIHGVQLLPGSVYAAIGARGTFQLTSTIFMNHKFKWGVQFPVGSKHLLECGRSVEAEGYVQGFPRIQKYLKDQEFQKSKRTAKRWSRYPIQQFGRTAVIDLAALPPVLPAKKV